MSRSFVLCQGEAPLPAPLASCVVAVGNFDGLHAGHRAVIEAAKKLAADRRRPAAVLTFEPHPKTFFAPGKPVFRLTPLPVKAAILEQLGLDGAIVLAFDAALAATSAEDFVDELLVRRLGVGGIVVGHDFHFGRGRAGTPALLAERGAALGLPVVVVPAVVAGTTPVSSSQVRAALEEGDIAAANRLLGYCWFVEAPVRHGDRRGRTLGYPTVNLRLPDDCRLRHGIYAVRAVVEGKLCAGVASFGKRPTFDDGAPLLEVHLFAFSGDLYDRDIRVEFVGFIRAEERFASAEALIAQMDRDSEAAQSMLAAAGGPVSMIGPLGTSGGAAAA